MSVNAVGLFCQDVRLERENSTSIVGVFAETANLTEFVPGRTVLPRLALYIRIHFTPDDVTEQISLFLQMPGDVGSVDLGSIDKEVIDEAVSSINKCGAPYASIYMRVDMSPFPIPALGWLKAILRIKGQETVVGALRFATGEETRPLHEITRSGTASIASVRQP